MRGRGPVRLRRGFPEAAMASRLDMVEPGISWGRGNAIAGLVNLEGQGLVGPVEEVGPGADAVVGVLGLVVVGTDEGGVPVAHWHVPFG